jgi:hypothetical protein
MAIKNILAQGIGFSPGSTSFMPVLGYLGDGGDPPASGAGGYYFMLMAYGII